jgi:DNA-binding NarL/FixJ family response regulator
MKSGPIKVLLIDEHAEDRASLIRCVGEFDTKFHLFAALSGKAGLDLFRTLQPDCVVVELKMEDMIGMEVLNLIKAEIQGKPVPIFVWTRLSHTMLKTAASTFGVRGYFEKSKGSEARLLRAIVDAMETE